MIWEDTPFADRIAFMKDNVMEMSPEFISRFSPDEYPGYENFRRLLLQIFADPEAFEGDDPLERFHLLSYSTQLFFTAAATAGSIDDDGETLRITKADFKKLYKKPGNAPFDILPGFGAVFSFKKKDKTVDSYGKCDVFTICFPEYPGIAAVLKQLAERFDEVDYKREYSEALVMLAKADYDRLILGRPALREEIDPLRPDIVASTGDLALLYREIISQAQALNLSSLVYLQRYANPTWNLNLSHGKKLRLKSVWCRNRCFVHVPIPFAEAETVILNRDSYPPRIKAAIERFGCVKCGRCKTGKPVKFKTVDKITFCTGHGESSTIFMEPESVAEVQSLFRIIEAIQTL